MTNTPTTRTPAAGAAATMFAMLIGAGLAACGDGVDTATSPSTVSPASTTTEPSVPSRSAAQVAHAYWEAIAASDPDAALELIHPAVANEGTVGPAGRGSTLAELFDWYDAVGWRWEVGDCTDLGDGAVDCDVIAATAWSDAIGIAPLATPYRVEVSDEGVTRLRGLSDDCCPGNTAFNRWVTEMYPDDAAVMWNESGPDLDPEILRLFEVNTARFADAHQTRTVLGDIDASSLGPLDSLSPTDIVVPTAPPTWTLPEGVTVNGERHGFVVLEDSGLPIEVWVGPCGVEASSCTIVDNEIGALPVPTSVDTTINGIEWGYAGRENLPAALIGDSLIVVEGAWLDLDVPLLDDPEIVAFLQGLRVGSPDDLPVVATLQN